MRKGFRSGNIINVDGRLYSALRMYKSKRKAKAVVWRFKNRIIDISKLSKIKTK